MALKDLTAYLVPNLDLPYGDKIYSVPPPSQETGLVLTALVTSGANAADGNEIPAETQALLDSVDPNKDVAELSLGEAVHAQMIADNVPGPHIDQFGMYAMYYWALGEVTADAIFEAQYGASEDEAPKDSPAPKNGPNTASAPRTKTASTRATGTRPKTSDRKPPAKAKTAATRGKTSSPTGD